MLVSRGGLHSGGGGLYSGGLYLGFYGIHVMKSPSKFSDVTQPCLHFIIHCVF